MDYPGRFRWDSPARNFEGTPKTEVPRDSCRLELGPKPAANPRAPEALQAAVRRRVLWVYRDVRSELRAAVGFLRVLWTVLGVVMTVLTAVTVITGIPPFHRNEQGRTRE